MTMQRLGRVLPSVGKFVGNIFPVSFFSAVGEIMFAGFLSFLVMCAIYPELLVRHEIRFTGGHDIQLPYEAAFLLSRQFLSGSLELWDWYDQINRAFLHLATGYFTLFSIIEGRLFAALSPYFSRPGEAFQSFHSVTFFGLLLVVRTIGGYAILKLYVGSFWLRVAALIVLNTLLASTGFAGLLAEPIYVMSLVIIYYFLRFCSTSKISFLFPMVFTFVLCFAMIPLMTLGYFYEAFHMMFFIYIAGFLIKRYQPKLVDPHYVTNRCREIAGRAITSIFENRIITFHIFYFTKWIHGAVVRTIETIRANRFAEFAVRIRPSTMLHSAILAIAALPVVMTIIWLAVMMLRTHFIAESGLGSTSGRFDAVLNPWAYLTADKSGASPFRYFYDSLNFMTNSYWITWAFTGSSMLGLMIMAMVFSRDRSKYLIFFTILLIVLLQFPVSPFAIWAPSHFINAFTNPFGFLVRGTHMTALFMPYFMFPLAIMGAVVSWDVARRTVKFEAWRYNIAIGVFLALAVYALIALPVWSNLQAFTTLGGGAVLLWWAKRPHLLKSLYLKYAFVLLVLLAVGGDIFGLRTYMKQVPYTGDRIQPRVFTGLEDLGQVVIDYQNPAARILPLYVRAVPAPSSPSTESAPDHIGYDGGKAIYFEHQASPGSYFHSIFLARHFHNPNLYEQRHVRYRDAHKDIWLQRHILNNPRFIYHADMVLDPSLYSLKDIVLHKLDGHTIILEHINPLNYVEPVVPLPRLDLKSLTVRRKIDSTSSLSPDEFQFVLARADTRDRGDFTEYAFALPAEFPKFVGTSIFTADKTRIRVKWDGGSEKFIPAQGRLIRPFTFDVGNVATSQLVVALPKGVVAGKQLILEVDRDPLVKYVRQFDQDVIDLTYNAPSDGWFVIRQPFENGFHASVNGRKEEIYVANKTSMAFAVKKGSNRVVISYNRANTRILLNAFVWYLPIFFIWLFWHIIRDSSCIRPRDEVDIEKLG